MSVDLSMWERGDLSQYFKGTYVAVNIGGSWKGAYVREVSSILDEDGDNSAAFNVDIIGNGIARSRVTVPLSPKSIKVCVPDSRYVNRKGECCYVSRRTSRQHKKGICESHFNYSWPSEVDLGESYCGMYNQSWSKDILPSLIDVEYPTFTEALENLADGTAISVAFDKHFCVLNKKGLSSTVLCYKGMICGIVEDSYIKLDDEFFPLQEKLMEIILGGDHE